jgi:serine/threonine protein kinase
VKQLHNNVIDQKHLEDFRAEAGLLKSLRPRILLLSKRISFLVFSLTRVDPNLVLFLGVTIPPQPMCLILEYCAGGSLYDYLRSDKALSPDMVFKILSQTAKAMYHLVN